MALVREYVRPLVTQSFYWTLCSVLVAGLKLEQSEDIHFHFKYQVASPAVHITLLI